MAGFANQQSFVEQHLPPRPARVLEIGCGQGDLARALSQSGFDVIAIDPHAPDGAFFRQVSLADFTDPTSFDAIIAIRSLHHIADLDGAAATMNQHLRPGGRLLIHEHAWERLDDRTARWYREQLARKRFEGSTHEDCVHDWSRDHHDLHTSTAMLEAIRRRFTEIHFAWAPYLHAELDPVVTATHEQSLIDDGSISAIGFNYVGTPL